MKKFKIDKDVFDLFPELQIAVLDFRNIDNSEVGRAIHLEKAYNKISKIAYQNDVLHTYINDYSQAMKKIKRKKGSLASIEAMAKRVKKGSSIFSVNPVVDLYNYISLSHLFTCGGEDLDCVEGDMVLSFANGNESFVPLGETENKPPREGELIYKDDIGTVVRSWLWREADRTKITRKTKNALIYMELINSSRVEEFEIAVKELSEVITSELGGTCSKAVISRDMPECIIEPLTKIRK